MLSNVKNLEKKRFKTRKDKFLKNEIDCNHGILTFWKLNYIKEVEIINIIDKAQVLMS